jgi:hypothetical protein
LRAYGTVCARACLFDPNGARLGYRLRAANNITSTSEKTKGNNEE